MPACTLTIQSPGGSRVLSFTPPVSLYRLLADNGVPVDMPWVGESCPSALQPLPPNRRRAENAHRAMRPEVARRPESLPNFSC